MNTTVFIIGCPRSGTTITLDLVASHPGFAWISQKLNHKPYNLSLSSQNRVYDLPFWGKCLYAHKKSLHLPRWRLPIPVEPWFFWGTYLENFQWKRGGPIPPRRRTEADITEQEVEKIQAVVQDICQYQHKDRFLSKYTGFPRIHYLRRTFPQAKFVHIIRDGRAVAHSFYEKVVNQKWGNWEEREWWIQSWPSAWREQWLAKYQNPLSLVIFLWKFFLDEIWADAEGLSNNQYLEVHYRDLMQRPLDSLANIFEFCGLGPSAKSEWYASQLSLNNMNYKWQTGLDDRHTAMLETIITEERFRKTFDD